MISYSALKASSLEVEKPRVYSHKIILLNDPSSTELEMHISATEITSSLILKTGEWSGIEATGPFDLTLITGRRKFILASGFLYKLVGKKNNLFFKLRPLSKQEELKSFPVVDIYQRELNSFDRRSFSGPVTPGSTQDSPEVTRSVSRVKFNIPD